MTVKLRYLAVSSRTKTQMQLRKQPKKSCKTISMLERQALQNAHCRVVVNVCRLIEPRDWKELHGALKTTAGEINKLRYMSTDGVVTSKNFSAKRHSLCACFYRDTSGENCYFLWLQNVLGMMSIRGLCSTALASRASILSFSQYQ